MTRSLDELVNRQARRWEHARRASVPRPRGPCIAMSRLPGAGAGEVGRRVAEWLDYGLFGREIVDQVAEERGVQRQLVAGLDEHVRSTIDRYVVSAFKTRPFTESDYIRHVVETIVTLGQRGMAVILGRGASVILPPEQALRVLVVAPDADRIERLAKVRGVSPEVARARLGQEDEDRAGFLRHHFGVDQNDPRLYDLVVNTGTLGIEGAAALVVEALRRRFPVTRDAASGP